MPVRYTITIDTENAAFEDNPVGEPRAVADQIADKIAANLFSHQTRPVIHYALRDTNGNLIGHIAAEIMPEPAGEDDA